MCLPLLCSRHNHSLCPRVASGVPPIRTCLPRARHAFLWVPVGSAHLRQRRRMLSAKRFEPALVRDRETAVIRRALLAVRIAPVLHTSFLPPPAGPRDRETAAIRQASLAVRVAPVLHASFLPPPA